MQADFGCSTLFEGMSSAPGSDAKMLGSVPWMAPEGKRMDWASTHNKAHHIAALQ